MFDGLADYSGGPATDSHRFPSSSGWHSNRSLSRWELV
jgi:hypothetical protein